jgi:Fe-S-cluster containining protein
MNELMRIDPADMQTDTDIEHAVTDIADVWHGKLKAGDQLGLLECLYAVFAGLRYQETAAGPDSPLLTSKVACKGGCSWCCHMNVQVFSAELDLLVAVLPKLPPVIQARARSEINRLASIGYSNEDRVRQKAPCPFLHPVQKTCTVYEVRPFACRAHHSTRVSVCRSDFYNCQSRTMERFQVDEIVNGRALLLRAAFQVLERWGLSSDMEEMTLGLAARLKRPTAIDASEESV